MYLLLSRVEEDMRKTMNLKVKAITTATFNDFGNDGYTYIEGKVYDAEKFSLFDEYIVHHPKGAELGFGGDFHDYFEIVK